MLDAINVEEELLKFLNKVEKEARQNLKRGNHVASKDLYNNIKVEAKEMSNSISAYMGWPETKGGKYAEFLNYGVKGKESGKSLKGYRYTNKKPPLRFIRTWLKQKRGRFRERSLTSQAFRVQNIIYKKGIKPTEFYSKPFEKAFRELPDDLIEAFGLDVDDFLEFIFKD